MALVAMWGGSFLYSLLLYLASPDRPVDVSYHSPGGDLRLHAESYVLDVYRGNFRLERPIVFDPHGKLLAKADHVEARDLYAGPGSGRALTVHATAVWARVVRNEKGELVLASYLPQQKKTRTATPFQARIDRLRLQLEDEAGPNPWVRTVSTDKVEIDGLSSNWLGAGSLDLQDTGHIFWAAENSDATGLQINLKGANLDLSDACRHFAATPDGHGALRDFRFETIRGGVRAGLCVRAGRPLRFAADLDLVGKGVRYREEPTAETAFFKGRVTDEGIQGDLRASNNAAAARFNGSLSWAKGLRFGGSLVARADDDRAIGPTLAKLLRNSRASFSRGRVEGAVGYGPTGPLFNGTASFDSLRRLGEAAQKPKFAVLVTAGGVLARVESGQWRGANYSGTFEIGRSSQKLLGELTLDHLNTAKFDMADRLDGLQANASGRVLLGGTMSDPTADFRLTGSGVYKGANIARPMEGSFDVAGRFQADQVEVLRGILRGAGGAVGVGGVIDVPSKRLALQVSGSEIDLSSFSPDATGRGAFQADISGTLSNWKVSGQADAYRANFRSFDIPVITTSFVADPQTLTATGFRAINGASEITMDLEVGLQTHRLQGDLAANNMLLADFTDQDVEGALDLTNGTISGTTDSPELTAQVSGKTLVAGGIKIDSVSAKAKIGAKSALLSDAVIEAAGGTLDGSATYDFGEKTANLNVAAQGLHLSGLVPPSFGSGALPGGVLSGEATLAIQGGRLKDGNANGTLRDVGLGDAVLGNGYWRLQGKDNQITGTGAIGQEDGFIEAKRFAYNLDTGLTSGSADVSRFHLDQLYQSAKPYLTNLSPEAQDRLSRVTGSLDTSIDFAGTWPKLNLDVPILTVDHLAIGSHALGVLNANFNREGSVWDIKSLAWRHDDTLLSLKGSADEHGELAIDGDLSNFDLSELSLIDDRLAPFSGRAEFSFLASGPTKDPVVQASLKSERFQIASGPSSQPLEFGLLLDSIRISESKEASDGTLLGGIEADGQFHYRGVNGLIRGQIPFEYPLTIPTDQAVSASIDIPKRSLASISEFFPEIDPNRTDGDLEGHVAVGGSIDDLTATGNVLAQAKKFGIKGYSTGLDDATAALDFRNNLLSLTLDAKGSAGGSLKAAARSELEDFGEIVSAVAANQSEDILSNAVEGSASLDRFRISEKGDGSIDAFASADLSLGGTFASPRITGTVSADQVKAVMPSQAPEAGTQPNYPIDPSFDIRFALTSLANARTTAASLDLTGGGQLLGNLSRPNLVADLVVEGGSLKLPTARLKIARDGALKFEYRVDRAGDTQAKMDVDLVGHTNVTTLVPPDTVERYGITINVRGDLLQEGGLILTAQSDPPGLSQDRILALLGQTDLIQSLGSSDTNWQDTRKQIQSALTGFAVPSVFDPFTSRIASGLGLEYLNVDYNAYEQASITFAKILGRGLVFQGRRQISEPVAGLKQAYDLRLNYRLPTRSRVFSRLVFSVGADQDRPWKIAVEYGGRF